MSIGELVDLIERSELLSRQQRVRVRQYIAGQPEPPTAEGLVEWLIQQKYLTRWQGEQLLLGFASFRIGNYTLMEHLGQGGMGAVFKAEHRVMGRVVALKELSKARLNNPRALARFRREVQAAARLNHPNIITAHDAGRVGDYYFLVMEYAAGRDLTAWIRQYGQLPISWACEFIRQAAWGLQHAFEQGLVHRDIKPANIIVVWDDPRRPPSVKILDLGLARFTRELTDEDRDHPMVQALTDAMPEATEGTITLSGQIVGTPDFLSPEQINGQDVDVRSDLFSLGCTLFKLITGQLPFAGKNLTEKLQARISQQAPPALPARMLRPEVSAELDAVLMKLLDRDPRRRYQTPAEVAEALDPFAWRMYQEELSETAEEIHFDGQARPQFQPTTTATPTGTAKSAGPAAVAMVLPPPVYTPGSFAAEADSDTQQFLRQIAAQGPHAKLVKLTEESINPDDVWIRTGEEDPGSQSGSHPAVAKTASWREIAIAVLVALLFLGLILLALMAN